MRTRKLRYVLPALAVLLLAFGVFALRPPPDRITLENYDRIRRGMSRAEVEALLGGPPGDYSTGPTLSMVEDVMHGTVLPVVSDGSEKENFDSPWREWRGDTIRVFVWFQGSTVRDTASVANILLEQDRVHNLLWRAKRQWRRWFPE